jgi:hypothetical protein
MWPGFPDQEPDRLLFPSAAGTPLDPKNVVDRVFKKALNRAGLRSLRWHDLRHTYASLQLESGANIKYLSMQMGHASVQITLDRYSHLLQDRHPAQAAKLSSLVFDRAEQADGCKPVAANVADGSTDAGGNPPKGPEWSEWGGFCNHPATGTIRNTPEFGGKLAKAEHECFRVTAHHARA